jgi:hypothetical protein
MTSQVDAYRARAAEYDREAETMGQGNAAIRTYYQALAQHWRSVALLAEDKIDREQSGFKAASWDSTWLRFDWGAPDRGEYRKAAGVAAALARQIKSVRARILRKGMPLVLSLAWPLCQLPYGTQAIDYLSKLNAAAPDKPFFLYYVPGATHAPHQPKPEWIEKFKGKFAAAAARKPDVRTGQFISGALNCSGAVEMYREATRCHLDPICMWCRSVDMGEHHAWGLLLQALFMIPPATSTTAMRTINKGMIFIAHRS